MDVLDILLTLSLFCFGLAVLVHHGLTTRRQLLAKRLNPPTPKERKRGTLPNWLRKLAQEAAPTGERYASAAQQAKIERWLQLAGRPYELDLRLFLGIRMLGVLLGMAVGVLLSFLFGIRPMLVLMVLGYYAPIWWLKSKATDRQNEIAATLPDFLDALAISLQAGVGFLPALKKVSRRFGGPLGGEFGRAVEEIDLGVPMADALQSLGQRTTSRDLELCVQALAESLELGVPVAGTLLAQAASVRITRVQRAKEMAAKASPKITLLTTFLVTPGVFFLLVGMVLLNIYYHPERYGIEFLFN